MKNSTVKVALMGGLAVSALTFSAGVSSAQPDLSPIVTTTCSYEQVMAALSDQRPDLAQQVDASPSFQTTMRGFLAAPTADRQKAVDDVRGNPIAQAYLGPIAQIAGSCSNY